MAQQKVCVRSYQEYPGSAVWHDYAVLCPECGEMCMEYGKVDTQIDGEWHQLCLACGDKVEAFWEGVG